MPGYLQPYQSSVVARAPGSVSTDLPAITDIGPKLGEIGKTAMAIAKPILDDKAQQQAIEDAGAATIVRTPEGGYQRTNLTHGGGLIYAKAYNDALDTRQLNMMEQDYLQQIDNVSRQWADDPTRQNPKDFFSFSSGLAEGMLQAAPPAIRADLDTRLVRHMTQANRGFAEATYTADRQRTVNDLQTAWQNKLGEVRQLAVSNGDPVDIGKQMVRVRGEAQTIATQLHNMLAIGDPGVRMQSFDVATADEHSLIVSTQSLQGIGPAIGKMSKDDLTRLSLWGQGLPQTGKDDETVGEMKFSDFRQLFPSKDVARQVGHLADDQLNAIIRKENADALAASLAAKTDTVAEVEANNDNLNYLPSSGLTHEQFAAATQQYDAHGPVADQLRDPARFHETLGFLAGTGTVPRHTNDALKAMVFSSDEGAQQSALNFISNAKNITQPKTGAWTGFTWYQSLPDDVKAIATFDEAMRRAGFNTTMQLKTIYAKTQGRLTGVGDIWGEYPKGQQDYNVAANATIAKEFGVKPEDLGASIGKMRNDFDKYMTINRGLYATKEQALEASAAMVATGWARDSIFVGNVGSKQLAAEGIPLAFMDKALAHYPELRSGNPTGATFSNGRVKIQAMDSSPGEGHPNYAFVFFNDQGQQLGRGAVYPMQRIVNAWHIYQRDQKLKADKAALDMVAPEIWKLERDHDTGQVRYVDNSAAYRAWEQQQAATERARTHPTDSKLGGIREPKKPISAMQGRNY